MSKRRRANDCNLGSCKIGEFHFDPSAPTPCKASRFVAIAAFSFKVPGGHHPRGTTLREALLGNLPLRGLCGGLSEGSAGSLQGFCGVSAGFCGGPRNFPRFFGGSDPMLVTLGNGWIFSKQQKQDFMVVHFRRGAFDPIPKPMRNTKKQVYSSILMRALRNSWVACLRARATFGNPPTSHRSLSGSAGPKSRKSLKKISWASGRNWKKERTSPFASDFWRRRGYRREFCNEDHFYPFSSQKKSRFASDFLCRSAKKKGSTPTPWARGLQDQIQKWALQTQKTLYF